MVLPKTFSKSKQDAQLRQDANKKMTYSSFIFHFFCKYKDTQSVYLNAMQVKQHI